MKTRYLLSFIIGLFMLKTSVVDLLGAQERPLRETIALRVIIAPRLGFDEESESWPLRVDIEIRNRSSSEIFIPTRGYKKAFEYDKRTFLSSLKITWELPQSSQQENIIIPVGDIGLCALRPGEVTSVSFDIKIPKKCIGNRCEALFVIPNSLARYNAIAGRCELIIENMNFGQFD